MEKCTGLTEVFTKAIGLMEFNMELVHIQHLKEKKRKENGKMERELNGALHISAEMNIHFK